MFEEDPWLPPQASPRKQGSLAIPRMPTKPITRAAYVYGPGQQYTLLPNFYPYTSSTLSSTQPSGTVTIQIVYPLDIGYRHRSQICLVEVLRGGTLAQGTKAVLRAYDPLFVRPDDLHTIPLPRTFPEVCLLISAPETTEISSLPLYSETSVGAGNGSPSASQSDEEEISQSMASSIGQSSSIPQGSQLLEVGSMIAPSTKDLNVCIVKISLGEANVALQSIARNERLALEDTYNASVLASFV